MTVSVVSLTPLHSRSRVGLIDNFKQGHRKILFALTTLHQRASEVKSIYRTQRPGVELAFSFVFYEMPHEASNYAPF